MNRYVTLVLFFVLFTSFTNAQTIYYVKKDATGANNGTSWTNAFISVQSALDAASENDQIWVAQGVYTPTNGADRTIYFSVSNKTLKMYGGFVGNESLLSQRNITTNLTILSGEIGDPADTTDNSEIILRINGTPGQFILDGFIIERQSKINGPVYHDYASSISLSSLSTVLINQCILRKTGTGYRSILFADKNNNVSVNNCTIQNTNGALPIFISSNSQFNFTNNIIENCSTYLNNIFISAQDTTKINISDCIFKNNTMGTIVYHLSGTKAVNPTDTSFVFKRNTITNNVFGNSTVLYSVSGNNFYISKCLFKNNTGVGQMFFSGDSLFIDSLTLDNNTLNGMTINTSGLERIRVTNSTITNNQHTSSILSLISNHIDVKNILLEGNTGSNSTIINISSTQNCSLSNLIIRNNTNSNAFIYGLENTFKDIIIEGNTDFNYNIGGQNNLIASGINVRNNINTSNKSNVFFGTNIKLSGALINKNTNALFVVSGNGTEIIENVTLDSNTCTSSTGQNAFVGDSLTVSNFKFTNNKSSSLYFNSNTKSCNLSGSIISNNEFLSGDFCQVSSTKAKLTNIIFDKNKVSTSDAVVHILTGAAILTGTSFSNNTGKALQNDAHTTIVKSQFINNSNIVASGAIGSSGVLSIYNTRFEKNISKQGAIAATDSLFINRCYFLQNTAQQVGQQGSAIYTEKYTHIVNSKFYKNSGDINGTIYNKGGRLDMYNNTLFNNKKGAVVNISGAYTLTNNFINNIYWNNGTLTDTFNIINLSPVPVKNISNCISNELLPGSNNLFFDPLLDLDLKISPLSPAINAGINYTNMPLIDYDSTNRIKLGTVDIGAYETTEDKRMLNKVQGITYLDLNNNCIPDTANGDVLLPNIPLTVLPLNIYTNTDAIGRYSVMMNPGSYSISAPLTHPVNKGYALACPVSHKQNVTFGGYNSVTGGKDFAYQKLPDPLCQMEVGISATYLGNHIPCFKNQFSLRIGSYSEKIQKDIIVQAIVPSDILILSASVPFTRTGDTVLFQFGDLNPFDMRYIDVIDSVKCNPNLIWNHSRACFNFLLKIPGCISSAYDHSNASFVPSKYSCIPTGTSLWTSWNVQNTGTGDMSENTDWYLYKNDTVIWNGKIKLKSNYSASFEYPIAKYSKPNDLYTFQINQVSSHPYRKYDLMRFSQCYTSIVAPYYFYDTPYYGNTSNWEEAYKKYPSSTETCISYVGSYDPNNKEVLPGGISSENYIKPNQTLTYTLNFQNTGTDTAFTVALVDTLDINLDINSIVPGASSHPYSWTLSGENKPVLKFHFDNINLPDSGHSQANSHGSVTFTIDQQKDLPDFTVINNEAGIYFDYNEPVITNKTFVTINNLQPTDLSHQNEMIVKYFREDGTTITNTSEKEILSNAVIVFPNPSKGIITFKSTGDNQPSKTVSIYNGMGEKLLEKQLEKELTLDLKAVLSTGIYYYKILSAENISSSGKFIISE